jgi:hypothetical protein
VIPADRRPSLWPTVTIGVLSAVCTWVLWGHLSPAAVFHDEAAYLLQAKVFAAGACTAPGAPAPEFFEQFHVLVTPFVAAKYPPGHALILAIGTLLGAPVSAPLALTGVAGALFFVVMRRLAGPVNAALAWALWIVAPLNAALLPGYFSEVTTLALGLAAWVGLARWWDTGERRWLVVVALCVGWMAITRPLTGLAWAVPIAVVVLARAWLGRDWPALAWPLALGCAVVALLPAWNGCSTGQLSRGPLALYTASYMPWDRPGFGLDSTPPVRATQPDLEALAGQFRDIHRALTPSQLPELIVERAKTLVASTYGLAVVLLLPLMFLGLFYARVTWVGVATVALVLGGYALYAHPMNWNIYYLEIVPVFCALPVLGAAWLRGRPSGCRSVRWIGVVGYASVFATIGLNLVALPAARARHVQRQQAARRFHEQLAALPGPAVVFVRYAADRNVDFSLVQNDPFFARARVWVAYDRGAENARLLMIAPDRRAFLYNQATDQLTRISDPLEGTPSDR